MIDNPFERARLWNGRRFWTIPVLLASAGVPIVGLVGWRWAALQLAIAVAAGLWWCFCSWRIRRADSDAWR